MNRQAGRRASQDSLVEKEGSQEPQTSSNANASNVNDSIERQKTDSEPLVSTQKKKIVLKKPGQEGQG